MKFRVASAILAIVVLGCGTDKGPDPVAEGWKKFESGSFMDAYLEFSSAYQKNTEDPEAANGLAWSLLRLDSVDRSVAVFALSVGAVPASDVLGGWSLALNATKHYSESNEKAVLALTVDPVWVFTHEPGINAGDLRITKAENYFVLGNFQSSLAEVKNLNAVFDADVATVSGRAELAAEIERLRGLNKSLQRDQTF